MSPVLPLRRLASSALALAVAVLLSNAPVAGQVILDHGEPVPGYGAPWPEFVPGTRYDAAIPTLEQVVGHAIRDEVTAPEEILRYFQALADAAPDRTRLIEYGRSWEGRPLVALFVGSPERIANLEQVGADMRMLADPRRISEATAETLISELPVIVALMNGIHGNEISPAGAGMAMAYHLLAARGNAEVAQILSEALVMIDPAQNPDGRARFVLNTRQARGLLPAADPVSAEHDEPWPGGRVNHYLFDLNRDWWAQTQIESEAKARLLLEYPAQVVADIHEMGGNSSYYFPPNAVPGNPWTTEAQNATLDRLGGAMADRFDQRGFLFFNRDTYDAFYPGYGVSWPMAQGAIGMTFEQASARGLVYRRDDGSVLTYGEGVLQQFTAAFASTLLAANERERLLREYYEYRLQASEADAGTAYILHSDHDPAMADRLAETLVKNGIEVYAPDERPVVDGRTLSRRGTWLVPLGQPARALVRNLLDRDTEMDADFVAEQIRRRSLRLRDQIYDVTAWSMPALWDVERHEVRNPSLGERLTLESLAEPVMAQITPETGTVAYLVQWGTGTAQAAAALLRDGYVIRTTGAEMTIGGRSWPVGTAILRTAENRVDLGMRIRELEAAHGLDVVAVTSSFTDSGTSFGSNATRRLRMPRVALVWEAGSTYSTGWSRYVLERRYGIPVTAIRGDALGRADLDAYDVLVMPSGGYGSFGDAVVETLREWMAGGGTLITMAESSRWAARRGLLATSTELRGGAAEFGDGAGARRATPDQPIDPVESLTPLRESPEPVPGAVLNVDLDRGHWLAAGTDGRIGALVDGSRVFSPLTLNRGTNVGRYAGVEELIASGIVWEEGRAQLAFKAWLMHQGFGRGQLVAFAEDPNYRAYAEASQLVFLNAVLVGPGR